MRRALEQAEALAVGDDLLRRRRSLMPTRLSSSAARRARAAGSRSVRTACPRRGPGAPSRAAPSRGARRASRSRRRSRAPAVPCRGVDESRGTSRVAAQGFAAGLAPVGRPRRGRRRGSAARRSRRARCRRTGAGSARTRSTPPRDSARFAAAQLAQRSCAPRRPSRSRSRPARRRRGARAAQAAAHGHAEHAAARRQQAPVRLRPPSTKYSTEEPLAKTRSRYSSNTAGRADRRGSCVA